MPSNVCAYLIFPPFCKTWYTSVTVPLKIMQP